MLIIHGERQRDLLVGERDMHGERQRDLLVGERERCMNWELESVTLSDSLSGFMGTQLGFHFAGIFYGKFQLLCLVHQLCFEMFWSLIVQYNSSFLCA